MTYEERLMERIERIAKAVEVAAEAEGFGVLTFSIMDFNDGEVYEAAVRTEEEWLAYLAAEDALDDDLVRLADDADEGDECEQDERSADGDKDAGAGDGGKDDEGDADGRDDGHVDADERVLNDGHGIKPPKWRMGD